MFDMSTVDMEEMNTCSDDASASASASAAAATSTATAIDERPSHWAPLIEVPLFDADGNPHTKAQIRKLRREARRNIAYERHKVKQKVKRQQLQKKKRLIKREAIAAGLDVSCVGKRKKKLMTDVAAVSQRIVVDCSMADLMTERHNQQLMLQLRYCYSTNRAAEHPLQFYITSVCGKTEEYFQQLYPEYQSWDIHYRAKSLDDTFCTDEIIYLTAESPNVLDKLDSSKVYVIGGLLDHNNLKGHTYEMAKKKGYGHARLPIGDHLKLVGRQVITVNQVYEMMCVWYELRNWRDVVLKVMPPRRFNGLKEVDGDENDIDHDPLEQKTNDCGSE